jgi:hypothetical protein
MRLFGGRVPCPLPAWLKDAGILLAVAAALVAKMWVLVTPWAVSRQYLGGDFGLAVEPYFYHELKRGVLPLWDPTIGTGSPFLGAGTHHPMYLQAHLHLFYPLNLFWLGLTERHFAIGHQVLQLHHVLHYVLGGVFAYLYGRALALDRFAANVLAFAFALSGFLLAHILHWTIVDTVVWLPLILACVVRADETEHPRWGALGGLFLGVAFLAGHPQIFYYVGLATVALASTLVGRRLAARRPVIRLAASLALVPAVALGVAAVQLLPTLTLGADSFRAGLDYAWKTYSSLPPRYLLQLLLPLGFLSVGDWRGNLSEYYLYAGLLPLALAGYALGRRWDWRIGFHAAIGLGGLCLAFGDQFGVYRLAYDLLPKLSLFRVPARGLALLSFAVAALAGLGANALLRDPDPRGLLRFLRSAAVVIAASLVGMFVLVVASDSTTLSDGIERVTNQLVLAFLLLLVILLAVRAKTLGYPAGSVRAGLMVALVLDLVFGSFPVGGDPNDPDAPSTREAILVQALAAERAPVRIARRDQMRPSTIYRHAWGVFDGESTFAPSGFLDLYGLRDANPRLVDLLNVKYFVAGAWMPVDPPDDAFRLWPGALRRLPVDDHGPVREIEVVSQLVYALDAPQGTEVATLHVVGTDSRDHRFPLRAGLESAEWAIDRPGARAAHGRPAVARSYTVAGEQFEGHSFRATFRLPAGVVPRQLVFERTPGEGVLAVETVRLDGRPAAARPERFRLVAPALLENRRAFPRAFLVRRARVVPKDRILQELKEFDPAEEILLTEPAGLPAGSEFPRAPVATDTPLPPVTIAQYTSTRIELRAEVSEPVFLVLSDTYHRGWQAWDNGRPVQILAADRALRALPLAPGRHTIEWRYRQPSVWIGLAVSLVTLAALAAGGLLSIRRARRRVPGTPPAA